MISAGPVKDLTLADITVGSRVVVHLNRSPVEPPEVPPEPPPTSTTTDATPTPISGSGTTTDATPTPEPPTPTPETGTSTAAVIESAPLTIHGLAQATTTTSTPPDPTPVPTATPTSTSTDPTPTPVPDDGGGADVPTFRTVTALRIHLKQASAIIKHKRAVGKCKTKGKFEVIDEDGEVTELEDESDDNGTSTAVLIPVESARIEAMLAAMRGVGGPIGSGGLLFSGILAQSTSSDDGSDSGNGTSTSDGSGGDACDGSGENLILLLRQKGKSTTTLTIRATLQAERIDERLARHIARLEARGDTDAIQKVTDRADQQKERIEQRLERTLARADARLQRDIQRALNKRKGPKASSDDGDGAEPTATPRPRGGGSSGGGSSSGGGRGNSGGGNN